MAAIDVVNRVFREHSRYTGDGKPGEPVNAPLPKGDPQSGPHNPKKDEIRTALLAPLEDLEEKVGEAEGYADRAEVAAQQAEGWAALAHPAGVTPTKHFAGDGVTTTFDLDVEPTSAGHAFVAIDGVLQDPTSYTVNGVQLIFLEPPLAPAEDVEFNVSVRVLAIADGTEVPPDGSVTTNKLAGNSVTKDKLSPGAVGAAEIESKSIDLSKLVDFATATILGRLDPGTGPLAALPLADLMSFGSNANGQFVRFWNGLQMCWATNLAGAAPSAGSAPAYSAELTWNFPSQFLAAPWVGGSVQDAFCTLTAYGATTASSKHRIVRTGTSSTVFGFNPIAVGRWK